MTNQEITVFYKWTAKEGQLETLKNIYTEVVKQMEATEPGALKVEYSASDSEGAVYIQDVFKDAGALGFHLSQTAGPHFPQLLEIATPGTFYFNGDVPAELVGAINGMGLNAEFSQKGYCFSR